MKSNWQLLSFGCGLVGATFLFSSGCSDKFGSCEERLTCVDGGAGDGNEGGSGGDGTGGSGTGGAATGGSGGETACEATCAGDTPHCDEESGECVGCVESEQCEDGVCDPDTRACVGCLEVTDCGAGAAVCNEDQECEGCSEDEDCERFGTTPTCDEDSGTCVQCLTEDDCGGNVCDPGTHECTDLGAHELFACEECEHDAQCQEGQLCVEQEFDGTFIGNFCTWRKDGRVATVSASCFSAGKPFAGQENAATSVDGAVADICVLATTTCPAFLQHRTAVTGCTASGVNDTACGVSAEDDGLCRTNTGGDPLCTYPCTGDVDCIGSFTCLGAPDGYCSL